VVPHGRFLLEQLRAGPRAGPDRGQLLAVGGVDYQSAPQDTGPRALELSGAATNPQKKPLSWSNLPGTARELEQVLQLAGQRPALVYRGSQASTGRLTADLPAARWAHVATHGFFANAPVRPVRQLSREDYKRGRRGDRVGVGSRSPGVLSGLVLAGANRPPPKDPKELERHDSGILTAEAIAALDLDQMDLAVLSACETGLGEVAGGEGVFGLQRAFHVAGCKNVVASLWKVDDQATAALMGLFYHQLWRD